MVTLFLFVQFIIICSYSNALRVVHGYLMSQYGLTRMLLCSNRSSISCDDSAGSTGTRPSLWTMDSRTCLICHAFFLLCNFWVNGASKNKDALRREPVWKGDKSRPLAIFFSRQRHKNINERSFFFSPWCDQLLSHLIDLIYANALSDVCSRVVFPAGQKIREFFLAAELILDKAEWKGDVWVC